MPLERLGFPVMRTFVHPPSVSCFYPCSYRTHCVVKQVLEAQKKCPHLTLVHVATLKDGDDEPKYHEKPEMNSYKVSPEDEFFVTLPKIE